MRCQGRKNQEPCWHWVQNFAMTLALGSASSGAGGDETSGSLACEYSWIAAWKRQLSGSRKGLVFITAMALPYHSRSALVPGAATLFRVRIVYSLLLFLHPLAT